MAIAMVPTKALVTMDLRCHCKKGKHKASLATIETIVTFQIKFYLLLAFIKLIQYQDISPIRISKKLFCFHSNAAKRKLVTAKYDSTLIKESLQRWSKYVLLVGSSEITSMG